MRLERILPVHLISATSALELVLFFFFSSFRDSFALGREFTLSLLQLVIFMWFISLFFCSSYTFGTTSFYESSQVYFIYSHLKNYLRLIVERTLVWLGDGLRFLSKHISNVIIVHCERVNNYKHKTKNGKIDL